LAYTKFKDTYKENGPGIGWDDCEPFIYEFKNLTGCVVGLDLEQAEIEREMPDGFIWSSVFF